MSTGDAERWNARYREQQRPGFAQPRPFLVENANFLPSEGLAIDIAMGLGGNAAFLLSRGLRVAGVDVSEVAVRQTHQRLPAVMAVVADLQDFHLPAGKFDVILNFFYLQRDLWPRFHQALRPGGVLVYETLTTQMLATMPDIDPEFLLKPGELRHAFSAWEILVYAEGWYTGAEQHRRATARMVARRPDL